MAVKMKWQSLLIIMFMVVVFFLGLYVYSTGKLHELLFYENMENNQSATATTTHLPPPIATSTAATSSCPDLLIKKDEQYHLFNTKKPTLEGSNPLIFKSLDEYKTYHELEKSRGSQCPILFLQQENNAQGQDTYRLRSGPEFNDQYAGLNKMPALQLTPYADSSRDNPPYNQGHYQGFDPSDQYVGKYTVLDKIHDSTQYLGNGVSPNPADSNWGGVAYTQGHIDSGVYDENNVIILTA